MTTNGRNFPVDSPPYRLCLCMGNSHGTLSRNMRRIWLPTVAWQIRFLFTPIVGKHESNPNRTHDTGKKGDRENLTRGPLEVPFTYNGPIITPTSVHKVYPGLARGRNHRSRNFTVMIHGHVGVDVCNIYDALVCLSAAFIDPASEKAREVTP